MERGGHRRREVERGVEVDSIERWREVGVGDKLCRGNISVDCYLVKTDILVIYATFDCFYSWS